MTRRGTILAAVAAATAMTAMMAASCWHPTFDPALSASELTVRKLGEPTLLFSVYGLDSHGMDDIWFMPQATAIPTAGVLVQDMGARLGFKGITIDALNHSGYSSYSDERSNALGDAYLIQAAPDGSLGALIVTGPSSGTYLELTTWTSSAATMPPTLGQFGIGSVALASANQAALACFSYPAMMDPRYSTVSPWSSGAPDLTASIFTITFSNAALVSTPGRFLSAGGKYYLSCGQTDGSRAIYYWSISPGFEPTGYAEDHGPLVGALSDGRLLAEENETITVLDSNLQELFSFPSGRLRFVHERYDIATTTMMTVFTRSVYARGGGGDGELRVEIFEIPTANLANLANLAD